MLLFTWSRLFRKSFFFTIPFPLKRRRGPCHLISVTNKRTYLATWNKVLLKIVSDFVSADHTVYVSSIRTNQHEQTMRFLSSLIREITRMNFSLLFLNTDRIVKLFWLFEVKLVRSVSFQLRFSLTSDHLLREMCSFTLDLIETIHMTCNTKPVTLVYGAHLKSRYASGLVLWVSRWLFVYSAKQCALQFHLGGRPLN